MSETPIVFGYVRVSGKSQVDGDGPERQCDAIAKFCKQHGLRAEGYFMELAVSGTVDGLDRAELTRLLQRAEELRAGGDPVVGVVVERLDRLARDLMVSEALIAELRRRGLKLYAVDQGALVDLATDEGDPMRKAIRQIMGVMAELDKSMIVKKLRAARDRKRAATGHCEGPLPFGSRPKEKPILAYITACRKQGMSYSKIARELNTEHESGLIEVGGWTRSRVQGILRHQKPTP
jgi:DNA invertase Pin-like site-specific DNA recombinase